MLVKEYALKFTKLSRYAPEIVAELMAWMSKFDLEVSNLVFKECRTTIFTKDIDISRLITHVQQIE